MREAKEKIIGENVPLFISFPSPTLYSRDSLQILRIGGAQRQHQTKKNVTKQKTCKTYLDHEYNSYAMMATTETEYLKGMLGEIANLSKRKEKG